MLTSTQEKIRPYFSEGVKIILWFFLIAAGVIFLSHSLLSVAYPYSLDYGEAPLIDQAKRLSAGENIYDPDISTPPYTIANYPPLYVISLIPFLEWFDSPFHMARVISVLAALISSVLLGLIIHHFTKDRLSFLVSALFFLASPYVVQWSGRARIDLLALVLAIGALYVLVRWPGSRWAWLGGGLLLVAAIFTRQSYALAAPFAAFVWLWVHNKRRAIELALFVGGLSLALFFMINFLTDGGFYYSVVTANVNEFGWERLADNLKRLWNDAAIILLIGVVFLAIGWRTQKSWPLLAPFLVGAFLSGLTIGKIGSNINYFLELAAALSLIAGIVVVWLRQYPWRNTAVLFLVAVQFGFLLNSSMVNNIDWILSPRYKDIKYLQLLEQDVKNAQGPILADEYMGLLTMNDRPLYLQPFEVSQLAKAGMWDQQPLVDEISSQVFDMIMIHHFGSFPVYKERWTPEMLAAIDTYYRPVKTLSGTVVYIPQGDVGIARVPPAEQVPGGIDQPSLEGEPILVGGPGFVGEASIAIDPTNPGHLVAIATRVSKQECELPNCKVELVFYDSADGGATWQERGTYGRAQQVMYHGMVEFAPNGVLYLMGVRNDEIVLQRTNLAVDGWPTLSGFESATRAQVIARPWLRAHPETGELFLSIDAQENDELFVTPSLMRSQDGLTWSTTARVDQHVSTSDIGAARATGLDDIQVLFGDGERVSLVWVWEAEPFNWPRTVWMANSTDGGITFSEPAPILETWGPINTASANGIYTIAYRTGDEANQQLAVASTADNGQSWNTTVASGNVLLYFDPDKGPGIDIAPNGTIDLVFYAHDPGSVACVFSVEGWRWMLPTGRIDSCEYNVFYTYSNDGGTTFAEPLKLNQQLISGEDFIRYQGSSQVGSHLALISADDVAYPIWIGTVGPGRTQVFTARITR